MDINLIELIKDVNNWHGRQPPFCPNEKEIEIYKEFIAGSKKVCLFGATKELMNLCDLAVDLNPINNFDKIIKSDWFDMCDPQDCIIGDGILNLYGDNLLHHISTISKTLVTRVFMKKLEGMKYAKFFPTNFPNNSRVIITQPDIAMVQWNFY